MVVYLRPKLVLNVIAADAHLRTSIVTWPEETEYITLRDLSSCFVPHNPAPL